MNAQPPIDTDPLAEAARGVEALRAQVASTAKLFGRDDLAGPLAADGPGRAGDDGPYVVVVGEKKRGKSSLINALLGRDDLLPVDVDIATSCYIAVRHGEPGAVALTEDSPDGVAIGLGAVAEWASVEGNQDPDDPERRLHEGVAGVEVTVDAPLLADGMVLVDTPGVGGLEAGHTELTLAALGRADALVFVIDPGGPLTAPELAFLERASDRVATVLFVLTKTDLYGGWRQVLDDDRELVARHAPRFAGATWIPASAALATAASAAAGAGDADIASGMREQSGMDRLAEALHDQVAPGLPMLRLENALQAAASVVTELSIAEQLRLRAAAGDPRLVDELDARLAELEELSTASGWPHDLQRGIAESGKTLQIDFQRRLRDARNGLLQGVRDRRALDLDAFTDEVDAVLRAQWVRSDTQRRTLVATLTAQLARQLSDEGFDGLARELPYPERLQSLPPLSARPPDERTVADYFTVAATGSILRSVGAVIGVGFAGVTGLGLMFGAGWVVDKYRRDRQQLMTARGDATQYVHRAFEEAASEMTVELRDGLQGDQDAIDGLVRGLLADRRASLERQVAAARAAVDDDERAKAVIRADGAARRERLRELATAGLALSTRLGSLSGRTQAVGGTTEAAS